MKRSNGSLPRQTRPREILVILPADEFARAPSRKWLDLFAALAGDWRVFWIRAPKSGETIETGAAGLDAVSLDTLPAIRRVISEHVISTVILVGGEAVESCLEALHGFASHIPYFVALDAPWPPHERGQAAVDALEFTAGLADRVLLAEAGLKASVEPLLRRVPVPVDVVPEPATPAFARYAAQLAGAAQEAFEREQLTSRAQATPELIALLPDDPAEAERRLAEWRGSLGPTRERTLLARETSPRQRARLERAWPGSRIVWCRSDEHRVELANRALRSCREEFALILAGEARAQPLLIERLVACGRKLPLIGAVGANRPTTPAPADWTQWVAFANAWGLKFNGSYRLAPQLPGDCLLVRRAVVDAVGVFDPRLGWTLAVKDYCLRLRQAGYRLVVAEDAALEGARLPEPLNGAAAAFKEAFIRKWNLDPLSLVAEREAVA